MVGYSYDIGYFRLSIKTNFIHLPFDDGWIFNNIFTTTLYLNFQMITYLPTNSDALIKAPAKKHTAVATLYCSLNGKSSMWAFSVSLVPIKAPNPKKVWYAMLNFVLENVPDYKQKNTVKVRPLMMNSLSLSEAISIKRTHTNHTIIHFSWANTKFEQWY